MSTRTTNDGVTSGQTGRFTVGQPDGLNEPLTGNNPGRPPMIWMTGGGTAANTDPAKLGMDRILDYLCDTRGYTIGQPNVPWLLGNPTSRDRINDCAAWLRANKGAVGDPIVGGVSNGEICAQIFSGYNPVRGMWGITCPVGSNAFWLATAPGSAGDTFGVIEKVEDAWGVTWDGTTLPDHRWSPYEDIANYPTSLHDKELLFYSCCDPLLVGNQMAFGAQIRADMVNIGGTGHLGLLDLSAGIASTEVCDAVDEVHLGDFIDGLWS